MDEIDIAELAELQRLAGQFIERITSMFGPAEAAMLIREMADQIEAVSLGAHPSHRDS